MPDRTPHVHEALLRLVPGTDPRAVGATVTVELCGAIDHEGPCRWPNNHDIEIPADDAPAVFRTLFLAPEGDVEDVHERVSTALRSDSAWTVVSERRRPLTATEERSAAKLAGTPRRR